MALPNKHVEVMEAIRDSIVADADIAALLPLASWKIQKKPWNRTQPWVAGARIAPLRRSIPAHENRVSRIILPVLVSLSWPSDGDLEADMSDRMGISERIEQIFTFKGQSIAPAPMLALSSLHSGVNQYQFEQTVVVPGDPFVEAALQRGFDALATVIEVHVIQVKTDESLLGA